MTASPGERFDALREKQDAKGAAKGAWRDNYDDPKELVSEALEELADTSNYLKALATLVIVQPGPSHQKDKTLDKIIAWQKSVKRIAVELYELLDE
jgi:hypothetical protein